MGIAYRMLEMSTLAGGWDRSLVPRQQNQSSRPSGQTSPDALHSPSARHMAV